MTDRRYGKNKYGDGKLYGTSDVIAERLAWDVSVDWDGDGSYESQEATRMTKFSMRRGRNRLVRPNGQGFESIPSGEAVISLLNWDSRYDGWNSASPIYPNVIYGREVRIRVKDLETATIYPIIMGRIVDIRPSGYGDNPTVDLVINDTLEFLRNASSRVGVQESITSSDAIGKVLDSVLWPTRWGRSIDTSSDIIRYWWATGDGNAMTELEKLSSSFLGYFFIDRSGQAKFVNRTTLTSAIADFDQSRLLRDIGNPQPYEIRRDVTRLVVYPRVQAATGTIWQLSGNIPSIQNGQTLVLFANYTYNDLAVPAINVVSPVANTDWTINTQSNGAGTNLTGSCTITFTDLGASAKIEITNNSGSNGFITLLKIRGDAIYQPNVAEITYPSSPPDNARELVLDLVWQQDVNIAVDTSQVMGPFFASLHPTPNVKVEKRPSLQFLPELFDIVSVNIPKIGLTGYVFRVGGIEHETIVENCQSVRSRFFLEPYASGADFWRWDEASVFDTETIFGW